MSFCKTFPRLLAVCAALSFATVAANAQIATRPREVNSTSTVTTAQAGSRPKLENDVFVVSEAAEEAEEWVVGPAVKAPTATAKLGAVERTMLLAIEERLGTPYRLGTEGPYRYDCSGFVWSVFQTAGVGFERSSARSLWTSFEPVDGAERFKFGTLVFFNNLRHVGIVADSEGFYHASTSQGVTYSRFSDYWLKRLDGFRRIPLEEGRALASVAAGR